MLCSKFKPKHKRIVISLQDYNLYRKNNESAQEWMDRLRNKAAECQYTEYDRLLTEQFISRLHYNGMINKIFKEVATLEDTEDAKREHVLLWMCRVEVQRHKKQPLMT